MENLFIHYVILEVKDHELLLPSDYIYESYKLLYNALAADELIYIQLCNNDLSEGILRYYDIYNKKFSNLFTIYGCNKFNLLTTSHSQLLYTYNGSFYDVDLVKEGDSYIVYLFIFIAIFMFIIFRRWFCIYFRCWCVYNIYIRNNDIAAYKIYNSDTDTTDYYLYDLNKDNDLLWDVHDKFPLTGAEYYDNDNDGIGDNGDIVDGVNDYILLYKYL